MSVIAWSPNLTPERAEPHGVRAVLKDELFAKSDVITTPRAARWWTRPR